MFLDFVMLKNKQAYGISRYKNKMKRIVNMSIKRPIRLKWFLLPFIIGISTISYAESTSMQVLTDHELSAVNGQALMSLTYLAPTDSANPMKNITNANNVGFYKLGLEAELALNANIKNLQLGCGGVNGAGACDIDIKNLSLSGLPDSYDSSGNPVYAAGRASTSALLTNPFIEFAITNPNSASTRAVKGFRLSAESINALLTTGISNGSSPSTTDGIQSLSGFMRVAGTTGTAKTQQTTFGLTQNQQLGGVARLCVGILGTCLLADTDINFVSKPTSTASTGITVPSVSTNFTINPFTINGVRQTKATVNDIRTVISSIPIAADSAGKYPSSLFNNDVLEVDLNCNNVSGRGCGLITLLKDTAKFKMGTDSAITNLNMKIDFEQSLSMFHNIPLTGTGGYLSVQDIALLWPGAYTDATDSNKTSLSAMSKNTDVAQPGWWMSFAKPIELGHLDVSNQIVLDDNILGQVAQRVTQTLTPDYVNKPQANATSLGAIVSLLADNPLTSKILADLGSASATNPVYFKLTNQKLGNQNVVSNCYGALKFC